MVHENQPKVAKEHSAIKLFIKPFVCPFAFVPFVLFCAFCAFCAFFVANFGAFCG